jgi:hypothetical protein
VFQFDGGDVILGSADDRFVELPPGGRREPLWYDRKGFFVVTLDRLAGEIVVRHYQRDYTPGHQMRGHSAEAIVLGLLREELISQYEQHRPLRQRRT